MDLLIAICTMLGTVVILTVINSVTSFFSALFKRKLTSVCKMIRTVNLFVIGICADFLIQHNIPAGFLTTGAIFMIVLSINHVISSHMLLHEYHKDDDEFKKKLRGTHEAEDYLKSMY